jgi:hypothetical protein
LQVLPDWVRVWAFFALRERDAAPRRAAPQHSRTAGGARHRAAIVLERPLTYAVDCYGFTSAMEAVRHDGWS